MGQYYSALVCIDGKTKAYSNHVDGEYVMLKLTEHSWWANSYVLAIASKFFRKQGRLAWVGDYADTDDFNWNDEFKVAYTQNRNSRKTNLKYNGFRLEGKYLLNHDKKLFINLDKYVKLSNDMSNYYPMNPVSLLTAVGNGKGGGDYHGRLGKKKIGTWTWDLIEITDQDIYNYKWNPEIQAMDMFLKEQYQNYTDVTKDCIFIETYDLKEEYKEEK